MMIGLSGECERWWWFKAGEVSGNREADIVRKTRVSCSLDHGCCHWTSPCKRQLLMGLNVSNVLLCAFKHDNWHYGKEETTSLPPSLSPPISLYLYPSLSYSLFLSLSFPFSFYLYPFPAASQIHSFLSLSLSLLSASLLLLDRLT